jgi:phosphoglycolate phosphatase-like HAD superfamily hydrolase
MVKLSRKIAISTGWDYIMINNIDPFLKILHPEVQARLGKIRHVLFDFDGTLSVLREGWETVMVPVMIEAICGQTPATAEIELEVQEYVEQSTGILTILQMEWLVDAVRRHGLAGPPQSAGAYKAHYLERLMVGVRERILQVETGACQADDRMLSGARDFLAGLQKRGALLYLISGTDHADVQREAGVLGLAEYFAGRIYGALDEREAHSKDRIVQRILDEYHLFGDELLVVGDGPVEIRAARGRRAIALGVASNEVARSGWNGRKVARLSKAGADLLIPDFSQTEKLFSLLFSSSPKRRFAASPPPPARGRG